MASPDRAIIGTQRRHDHGQAHYAAIDCWGAIIDVQEFFLSQVGNRRLRSRIETNTMNFVRLLDYFRIPIVATLERPIYHKGALPKGIKRATGGPARNCSRRIFSI